MFESKFMRIMCAGALFLGAGYFGVYAKTSPSSEQGCSFDGTVPAVGVALSLP